ncbi:MAG: hypothetical protein ACOH2M_26170 [Cypionkella sp.]
MDLSVFEPVEGTSIPVLHPVDKTPLKDEKTGEAITVDIVGQDSEQYRARARFIQNSRLKTLRKGGDLVSEETEIQDIGTVAACITGWKHIMLDGKVLEFNKANARVLLTRLPWLREDIDRAIVDRANFLKASSTD